MMQRVACSYCSISDECLTPYFILSFSDENALSAEQMQNIIEYLPTSEERRALEAYMLEGGQDAAEKFDGLCECEKFMVSMMTVKHAKRKVRALLFKLQFDSCIGALEKGASRFCFVFQCRRHGTACLTVFVDDFVCNRREYGRNCM
jgi:hypothetical protein